MSKNTDGLIHFNTEEFDEIIEFLQSKIDFDFSSCSRFSLRVEKRGFIEIDSVVYAKPKRDQEDEVITMISQIDGSISQSKRSEMIFVKNPKMDRID